MLNQIYLKNFAIIDEASVSFKAGFNVLSGETGAGKSILIDALGLQLGDRADSSWIRQHTQRSEIHSDFTLSSNSHVIQWLKDHELDEDHDCLLRRTLNDNGKSKCYINGIPTTLANTKALGEDLVDIHGQHTHQSLLHADKQLNLLDNYAKHQTLLNTVQTAFNTLQQLLKKQQQLQKGEQNIHDKLNLYQYQYQEITDLNIEEGEFEHLSQEQKTLANATQIVEQIQNLNYLIDESEHNVKSALEQITHSTDKLRQFNDKANEAYQLFEQSQIYLDEGKSALDSYASNIDIAPERLSEIERRMSQLHDLSRKHHIEPSGLLDLQHQLKTQLQQLSIDQATLDNLDNDINLAQKAYQQATAALTQSRKSKAAQLIKAIVTKFVELGMDNAKFNINFERHNNPHASGQDKIIFMFSPNPGQGEKPLHKIASGGELSRISLAIQVASVSTKEQATLIFDEVDSGIGGATAEVVGRMLKTLSKYNQIICVTHLAQVAAFADHHIYISKSVKDNNTFTHFKILTANDSVHEIARMSGGLKMDKKTLEHAQNMLDNAHQFNQKLVKIS